MLRINPLENPERVRWFLPPSKSHMIRWIALSSQCESRTELVFEGVPGEDIESMARCMEKMGASIVRKRRSWSIKGKVGGLDNPGCALDCGNSATTANFVTAIVACLEGSVKVDGDISLRKRDLSPLTSVLRELGCNITSDRLPYTVNGPINPGNSNIDESLSSQTLSGIIMASPGFPSEVGISLRGDAVSRWYRDLTLEIAVLSGLDIQYGKLLYLSPWSIKTPKIIEIPAEFSLLPISLLFDKLHGTNSLESGKYGDSYLKDAIEKVMSGKYSKISLRDYSDIIAPVAALMAIGGGGKIVDASHARGKESNRILSTISMLGSFGIEIEENADGLKIPGGQELESASRPINCEDDHRLAMTAAAIATKVGSDLFGHEICDVTHPGFLEMILTRPTEM